jgi:glycosyltransferase involved in cell wall biosynthesis
MGNIMFLTHSAEPAGAELSLLRLVRHMPRDQTRVVFTSNGVMVGRFQSEGLPVDLVRSDGAEWPITRTSGPLALVGGLYKLFKDGVAVASYVRKNEVSVVVARSTKALFIGFIATIATRRRLVWSVHDRISPEYFGSVKAHILKTFGLCVASGFIVNSAATLETIKTGNKPMIVVPPGLELVEDRLPRVLTHKIKSVGIVGRLAEWKGQDVFLRAFARVFGDSVNGVCATVVGGPLFGETKYQQRLHELVQELNISHKVQFTGHVESVAKYLDGFDVLVHASVIPEPFGAVVIEGMDAGCAVIATCPGGPAEIITDGVDGRLVPCGDEDALVDALRSLNEDADLRVKLASTGMQRAKDFDVIELARRTEKWLAQLDRGQTR